MIDHTRRVPVPLLELQKEDPHMINHIKALIACVGFFALASGTARAEFYTPVSLTNVVNNRLQNVHPDFPTGNNLLLGDVPFNIPTTGNNTWFATVAANQTAGTVSTTIPINIQGVLGVHTLINTFWGSSGTPSLASLTFTFDDNTTFVKTLIGDTDVRDYYQNVFTNSINNTSTVRVFFTDNDGPAGPNRYRLDKQFVDLSPFSQKTLVSMKLTDSGNQGIQRTFLSGVTVQTVPEPSAFVLTALGATGVLALMRRRGLRSHA